MTLATLPRSSSLPMSRSQARARVAAAASALQRTIDDLYAADKAQAAQRERDRAESDAKAKRLVSLAQARQATRELRVEVPAKWFWDFSAEALDALIDPVYLHISGDLLRYAFLRTLQFTRER
jgi:hypothetical protein